MESRPRHIKNEADTKLYQELKELAQKKMESLPKTRLFILQIKLFLYPILYFSLYAFALLNADKIKLYLFAFAIMGILVVVIFCELIHELTHNTIFKKSKHNQLALNLFDLLGANSYIWQQRHLKLHHHFPNVNGWDADIEQKGPVSLFTQEKSKSFNKYQHRYIFFLYPLFMLNWLFIRDFRDFFSKNRIIRKIIRIPQIEYVKLFIFKSLYIIMILVIPISFTGISVLQGIGGLLSLTVTGSLLAMMILLTPHINDGNEFPKPENNNKINITWFRHQLITTNDIENSNWLTRNLLGNFNFHVVHHLFPNISSVYTPEVTQLLKSFCIKNNLPYKSYHMLLALRKHYSLIKKNAFDLLEEDL